MQVTGLEVEQQVVVLATLSVVAQLVVAEREVVEAFAAAVRRGTEDFGEQSDTVLLVTAFGGFDKALGEVLLVKHDSSRVLSEITHA